MLGPSYEKPFPEVRPLEPPPERADREEMDFQREEEHDAKRKSE